MSSEHTWPLHIRYHQCPKCEFIIESRHDYQYVLGQYKKDLTCPRCHNQFTLFAKIPPSFGPLIGHPQPPEFDWQ